MAVNADTPDGELSSTGDVTEVTSEENENADVESPNSGIADNTGPETGADNIGTRGRGVSPQRVALVAGLIIVLTLGGLSGWLGYHTYQSRQATEDRELYLKVARQGALNLTTIDYEHADTDIQRILDSATGQFHDDFAARSQPFVAVVKQVQSKSVGTITEAGLESATGDAAQAIVAVSVKTSNAGAPEQQPRAWRMRLTVQKVGEDVKVSNVGFVA
ncbi:hypothetical protein [Mycolicibacterium porcinum]|uniref:Mammalian cell entry protein n=1 Tax=Mycolicibacterium porcinum TaxID=39693 RepID=A0AAW5T0X3_9MYCO|nr:hypothetical protein [Mycolicibacterium porcinum]MCV7388188.1 mammalian cell entry protein [Mycolicibacterium porcinum]ORB43742.1 mammalian cell entry protein [Mycolicibacterium porcinum]CDO31127.1 Mce associated membrane protein [Mycolicibacterium vulneris]